MVTEIIRDEQTDGRTDRQTDTQTDIVLLCIIDYKLLHYILFNKTYLSHINTNFKREKVSGKILVSRTPTLMGKRTKGNMNNIFLVD